MLILFQKSHYSSLILLLKCLWYHFGTHDNNFWWFYENLKKYFFTKKKQFFSKKAFFFSKTSIMEDLHIDEETWILHQCRRLYPQHFRFYTYSLNFIKKNWLCLFPIFLWYYIHIQYSKNDVLYAYSKIFMGNRQTKFFFYKNINSKHNLKIWWYYHWNRTHRTKVMLIWIFFLIEQNFEMEL